MEQKNQFQRDIAFRSKGEVENEKATTIQAIEAKLENEDLNLIERAKLQQKLKQTEEQGVIPHSKEEADKLNKMELILEQQEKLKKQQAIEKRKERKESIKKKNALKELDEVYRKTNQEFKKRSVSRPKTSNIEN